GTSSRGGGGRLRKPLLAVVVPQRLDQFAQVAGDDGVQLVQAQLDPVVGDPVLREVVGADLLAAVARADLRLPLLRPRVVELLLLPLVRAAAGDAHGPVEVLVLAALVLALPFQLVGGALFVPDADGALGFVDVLAARPAGAHLLPLDVLV